MVFQNDILAGATGVESGYVISQSARFNDADSPELSRTYSISAPWTLSVWVKRCEFGSENLILGASGGEVHFNSDDTLEAEGTTTSALFRDPSAWYHIHVSNNGLYINGVSYGSVTTTDLTDQKLFDDFDGYVAEVHLQSGTSAYTNFGEVNNSGVWIPKAATATGDTYLTFANSSNFGSNSGTGANWTASGLTSDDQVDDSPTSNYCLLNIIDPLTTGTLSDGNLVTTGNATVTIRPSSGQWYYEKDGVGVSYNADTSGQFNPTLGAGSYNFGQLAWADTGPTGSEQELRTTNLPEPTIKDGSAYFQTTLYTGNGTAIGSGGKAVTQSDNSVFQPDLVWIKERNDSADHALYDAVRGATEDLAPNITNAETTQSEGLTTFDSSGFTVGNLAKVNTNSDTYVAWQWLAGNSTSSNTDGDITSTVSVNTTAGFSILTYSGSGTAGNTVGHGLGATPSVVIVKPRNASDNWIVSNWETGVSAFSEKLLLNATDAASSASGFVTAADSTTFTLGSDANVNGSGRTFVAYCWNEVEGFSKFGTYTGNGSADGPFVWCGFRPNQVVVKEVSAADDWVMYDSARDSYNVAGQVLRADSGAAEFDGRGGSRDVDFLSNGFKFRTSNTTVNFSGSNYIFWAFAEHPFGGNGVAPATAR